MPSYLSEDPSSEDSERLKKPYWQNRSAVPLRTASASASGAGMGGFEIHRTCQGRVLRQANLPRSGAHKAP